MFLEAHWLAEKEMLLYGWSPFYSLDIWLY